MTWRRTLRSLAAESRRIQREQLKLRQEQAKREAAEQAAKEVAAYENYLDRITSLNRECREPIDWDYILRSPAPLAPIWSNRLETEQRRREAEHPPGILDRLLGRVEGRLTSAHEAIERAKAADQAAYHAAVQDYERQLELWKKHQRIASGVLAGDPSCFQDAIDSATPLAQARDLGHGIRITAQPGYVEATVRLHGIMHVPSETKSLLKSGKISVKKAPAGFIQQTYQSHVCSSALHVAREIFAILPIKQAFVQGVAPLLNTRTGHKESRTILSVLFTRDVLATINFDAVDPVDCMRNFVHRMAFTKQKGFSPIDPLDPADHEAAPFHRGA